MASADARRARSREVYAARVAARRCVRCNAGLQELDGVRCVECTERDRATDYKYKASSHGRAQYAVRQRRWRADARVAGRCADCLAPAAPGRRRCEEHLAATKVAQALYLERKAVAP